ncbi:MAG: DUF4956 domain-containing protein [Crocinitomicaceae bacterium]|jgi:hypothetical protein|nr:DUF4956 domain-containing protein [Crocinitomicaceae bacterium]|tara:strand:- start:337 stop:939 length:603 start_codon:yes stop_codon:yes gene_type:complete
MELYGIAFFDLEDFSKLLFKFGINFIFLIIIVRLIYYRIKDDKDYVFTFIMFNILTFFICFLLRKVPMQMGFALGLFAVFGILRYRTEAIPIRQMTYLFIVIGISMINALSNKSISIFELIFTNGFITLITYLIDRVWFQTIEESKNILYEKIDLIKPENQEDLIQDLKERTGLPIHAVKIVKIDFLRDTASITIYYNRL